MKLINSLALLSAAAVNGGIICKGSALNYHDCYAKCQISLRCFFDIVASDDWHAPCTKQGRTFNLIDQTINWKGETYEVSNDLDNDSVKVIIDKHTRSYLNKGVDVQFRMTHMCTSL